MLKASTISLLLALLAFSAYGSDQDIVLGPKNFYDSTGRPGPEIVYVSGTLTGEGIGYKNNSTFVACYSDQKECFIYWIEQIGEKHMSSLSPPAIIPIVKWNRIEIVASGSMDIKDCTKVTVSISRTTQDAVWVTEPMNRYKPECEHVDATIYRWHLEDPLFWKNAKAKMKK